MERVLLSDALTELASVAADPFDVSELVHRASELACQVLASDGAVIFLSVDGSALETAGASAGMPSIDDLLLGGAATPCHDALTTGAPVAFDADHVPERFADFAVIAARVSACSVVAAPLRHRARCIGVMCVMRTKGSPFSASLIDGAQKLADVVAAGIVRERAHRAALEVTAQLEHALEARVVVEQAKGMVAAELRMSIADALELLRAFARRNQIRLAEVATDIVSRELATVALLSSS